MAMAVSIAKKNGIVKILSPRGIILVSNKPEF